MIILDTHRVIKLNCEYCNKLYEPANTNRHKKACLPTCNDPICNKKAFEDGYAIHEGHDQFGNKDYMALKRFKP